MRTRAACLGLGWALLLAGCGDLEIENLVIEIISPGNGSVFTTDQAITFEARVKNDQGDVVPAITFSVSWTSDRDGLLGEGTRITVKLSEGEHKITAEVTRFFVPLDDKTISVRVVAPAEDNTGLSGPYKLMTTEVVSDAQGLIASAGNPIDDPPLHNLSFAADGSFEALAGLPFINVKGTFSSKTQNGVTFFTFQGTGTGSYGGFNDVKATLEGSIQLNGFVFGAYTMERSTGSQLLLLAIQGNPVDE